MEIKPMIVLENINKSFGKTQVLANVSLELYPGNIYGFVGYNGSGKTVLFKCICGFLTPDSGKIYVKEKLFENRVLTEAGIIIENPAFISGKSGYKNLELLYMLNHKRNKRYVSDILEKVGLSPSSLKHVKHYSLGMKQRLAIGQAIMEDPEILVLDEPMNGLDKNGVQEVRKMLLEMKEKGILIILASHNREDIEVLCDEVYEMEAGKVHRRT